MSWAEILSDIATNVSSMSIVGSALFFVYRKFILPPIELKKEKRQQEDYQKSLDLIDKQLAPIISTLKELTGTMKNLNSSLDKSNGEIISLSKMAKINTEKLSKHSNQLADHDDRLMILEFKSGVGKYTEVYKSNKGSD